ncbi:MAG TPA: hypothetical protein VM737_00770 [Gemmatimonadota bacterium]|nr:hypothetical protein [Gemmatimonadota bacterium]
MSSRVPDPSRFTRAERRLIDALRTPRQVQRWLRSLPYNWKRTLRTFRGVVGHGEASCLEAVLAASVVLEQHGHPPIVLDLESQDGLDHVLSLYRSRGRWGTIGKSRDPGLHGRKAVFRRIRDLAYSYVDPYVDGSGRITGYGVFHLDDLTRADWRLGEGNVQSVERALIAMPHTPMRTSDRRYEQSLRRYRAFRVRHPGRPADFYAGRERWL